MTLDLSLVTSRLREIPLHEFNSDKPIIFVEAEDPDDACYKCIYKLASVILQKDPTMAKGMRELLSDVYIKKIIVP